MDGITSIPASGQIFIKNSAPDPIWQKTAVQDVPVNMDTAATVPYQESILDIQSELAALAPELNQRLEFSFYKALGQVIVKIIDRQTDTVIKELPPTEFQRVHVALREAIGLLIDKKV
jgi:uncharacterized FlaG/YvyC family protein